MTDSQASHITVAFEVHDFEFLMVYAVSEDIIGELDRNLSGAALKHWLEDKGCRLDSSDGPAYVFRFDQRLTAEKYFRDGRLHREDGPAIAWRGADGST